MQRLTALRGTPSTPTASSPFIAVTTRPSSGRVIGCSLKASATTMGALERAGWSLRRHEAPPRSSSRRWRRTGWSPSVRAAGPRRSAPAEIPRLTAPCRDASGDSKSLAGPSWAAAARESHDAPGSACPWRCFAGERRPPWSCRYAGLSRQRMPCPSQPWRVAGPRLSWATGRRAAEIAGFAQDSAGPALRSSWSWRRWPFRRRPHSPGGRSSQRAAAGGRWRPSRRPASSGRCALRRAFGGGRQALRRVLVGGRANQYSSIMKMPIING